MRTCYDCCCISTSDNPVVGMEDDYGVVTEWLCIECLAERESCADTYTDD